MPFATRDGVRLYWRLQGEVGRPPLVLLHSIGTDATMWDRAAPALAKRFRLLRLDLRGHGASDAPDGDYALAGLAADVLAVMDAAGIDAAAVAGVSLGGMIALQLALDAPERVSALVPICTSVMMDEASWNDRIATVRAHGVAAIADAVMERFLSAAFSAANPAIVASIRAGLLATPREGYAGAGAAIRDMALLDRLIAVAAPTLVVAGTRDASTPFAGHGDRIAAAIPGATVATIDAGHLAPVEDPGATTATLVRFLLPDPAGEQAAQLLFDSGLITRRRVLGDEWVDRSLAARTPFNADFQAMISRTAWHEIWSRPGLDDTTRRLLVVSVTASLGRWEEFRLHVRAGLERGGFTVDQLREALMQLAVYAGVPAANTAFAEAEPIVAGQVGRQAD